MKFWIIQGIVFYLIAFIVDLGVVAEIKQTHVRKIKKPFATIVSDNLTFLCMCFVPVLNYLVMYSVIFEQRKIIEELKEKFYVEIEGIE